MVFVLCFGSYAVITSQGLDLDVGQMSSMLTYSFQILMSLMMLSMVFVMITMADRVCRAYRGGAAKRARLHSPENAVTEVKDGSDRLRRRQLQVFQEGRAHGPGRHQPAHQARARSSAFIGGTGSSKTSLIQLIPRLYDVTEGCVKVGGVDVRKYDLETLRNQVAVVLQKNVLFSGTIKDNLRWGNPDATDEQMLEEACQPGPGR